MQNPPQDYEDVNLTYADIQALSSREQLIAFFTRLSYDTENPLVQTLNSLSITNDRLRDSVKFVERIAFHEDLDTLAVLLFEVNSLSVWVRNELVQRFRNLNGNFLLVLTEDYSRLDFVLVERYNPMFTTENETVLAATLPSMKPVLVRPHVFQLDRTQTGEEVNIALRTLRRFSYTEPETLAQYEKLLNAYTVAAWSKPFFNNRALFSDYYLLDRLPKEPEWSSANANYARMRRAYREMRNHYETVREMRTTQSWPSQSAVQNNRTLLIEPVLAALGFSWQQPEKARDTTADPPKLIPDYRLFSAETSHEPQKASNKTRTTEAKRPIALALAYEWARNLDGKDSRGDIINLPSAEENPGAVAVSLLDSGEADWVIVTNGIVWRLYAARAHSRATNYYEINIPELLALNETGLTFDTISSEKAFHYFWHFFRAAAFVPTEYHIAGETREISWLDYLLIESEQHARALGERLKNRVFEEIFPYFALGFVNDGRRNGLLPDTIETMTQEQQNELLKPYFEGTLTFLYRLLFLFYAESRDLLPVHQERVYAEHSLEAIKQQIARDAGSLQDRVKKGLATYSETETTLYDRLVTLFQAVDKGNAALNVPIYNGGLFMSDPPAFVKGEAPEVSAARFLREHKITDQQLALGLDLMARDVDEALEQARAASGDANAHQHSLVFIDYKGLGVRHLGSIYEGLLEFKLRIAPETMAVVAGKHTEEVIPLAEAQRENRRILKIRQGREQYDRLYQRGALYLENDRRERKATGSYYTPDYIVQYIVEQTVGPLLKEKLDALRVVFRSAERFLRDRQQLRRANPGSNVKPEQEAYNHFRMALNEAFFDLKVLDPAMGSGHFLVETVDYITDHMARWLTLFKWNPIVYEMGLTRATIEQEMKRQGVTVDSEQLTDLNLLKRRVLKSCIYGVDLNPMAVELTKISLWLDSFTLGAPLSFLDHHIKCGNSLIGAETKDVLRAIQESLWGYQSANMLDAAKIMSEISKRSDITAQEVADSRHAFQNATIVLQPHKNLYDVWLSQYFGNNKKTQQIASQYAQQIIDGKLVGLNDEDRKAIEAAPAIAQAKRFFHWELEFPEVYFNRTERRADGGFDVVLGNPPYVRQEGLGEDKTAFKELYSIYNSISDLYTYFFERARIVLRPGGRFSMITANKFMRANYGAALRKFLLEKVKLEKLIDFGDLPVFEEATTYPIIVVFTNSTSDNGLVEYALIEHLRFTNFADMVDASSNSMPESAFTGSNWSLAAKAEQSILDKLKTNSVPLEQYLGNDKIHYGIKTGYNEAFVIDRATRDLLITEDPKSAEIIKPFLVGEDVQRYAVNFQERYLIWTYIGVPIDRYPAIYRYLQRYQTQLEKRWDKGKYWWELRHCDYYDEFEKPKIIFPDIAKNTKFSLDVDKHYSINTTYIISVKASYKYLTSLLNSSLIDFFYRTISASIRGGYMRFFTEYVIQIPIFNIKFVTTLGNREYYKRKAALLYQQCLQEQGKPDCVLGFVDHHLAQGASDVVHDLLESLAETMLDLNRQKQEGQKAFLATLVELIGIRPNAHGLASIDSLTGKGKLLNYTGDYKKDEGPLSPDELWTLIKQNRARIYGNPSDEGLKNRVLARYQQNLDALLPVKEQLRYTDHLIDQVVYRLYGLNEEEIAVVEGTSKDGVNTNTET